MRGISYKKPTDVNEIGKEKVDKILENREIYIQEKVDGTLSDSSGESCIELEKDLYMCFFGENMNIRNFHILHYTNLPAARIVFDVMIYKEDEGEIYLPPEIAAFCSFFIGMIFIPIIYKGKKIPAKKIENEYLNRPSLLDNTINPNLLKILEKEKKLRLDETRNFREGVVIKSYSGYDLLSFKMVKPSFEDLLKEYPREKYGKLYVENKIRLYSPKEYEEYWRTNIFYPLGIKVNRRYWEIAYSNYIRNYRKETASKCLESIDKNSIKKLILRIVENYLHKNLSIIPSIY